MPARACYQCGLQAIRAGHFIESRVVEEVYAEAPVWGMTRYPRRKPTTPRSQVRSALRQLWLRSRERREALKRDKYTCVECGVKQSKAKGKEQKVEVDHLRGAGIEKVIDAVFRELLVGPEHLETVCPDHHKERTEFRKQIGE